MKRILCVLLCWVLAFTFFICFADEGEKHEEDIERIFLNKKLTENSKDPQKSKDQQAILFGYLEDAIYLCLDQMGNHGQKWLDELNNDFQVEGLPKSINEFTVPIQEHEKYTHLGWDYKFYEKKEAWSIRQKILLATVSKVFGFSKMPSGQYDESTKNMAKLLYYIHILGDIAGNKVDSATQRIQLRNAKITAGEYSSGLIKELRKSIKELFASERTSGSYNWLMVKLNSIRFRAWIIGEEDEDNHKKIQQIARDTLQYLHPHLRKLLLKMDYFSAFK